MIQMKLRKGVCESPRPCVWRERMKTFLKYMFLVSSSFIFPPFSLPSFFRPASSILRSHFLLYPLLSGTANMVHMSSDHRSVTG